MMDYLKCMKYTSNKNAPNCRLMAKSYLRCRMENELMDESDWDSLGLINLPGEPSTVAGNIEKKGASKTEKRIEKDQVLGKSTSP